MTNSPSKSDDNVDALKRLRALPRGTQVESRIAAIQSLLGDKEIFRTLTMLRWPEGIVCPRCRSSNVVRRDPPPEAVDQRHYYECLNCKGRGSLSTFDDLTGLAFDSLTGLRKSILCWYLIGFCSLAQIAKILGLSMNEVAQMAHMGTELAEIPEKEEDLSATSQYYIKRARGESTDKKNQVETQEEYTRSASKNPLKPGYKSKL